MIRQLLCVFWLLIVSLPALATECYRFNNTPNMCLVYYDCAYDYRTDRCHPAVNVNRCSDYSNDAMRCNTVYGCRYDYYYKACFRELNPPHDG